MITVNQDHIQRIVREQFRQVVLRAARDPVHVLHAQTVFFPPFPDQLMLVLK